MAPNTPSVPLDSNAVRELVTTVENLEKTRSQVLLEVLATIPPLVSDRDKLIRWHDQHCDCGAWWEHD